MLQHKFLPAFDERPLLLQAQALEGLGQENSTLAASNEALAQQLSGSASLSVSLDKSALCWRGNQDSHIVLTKALNSVLRGHVYVSHFTPSTLTKSGNVLGTPLLVPRRQYKQPVARVHPRSGIVL